MTSDAALTVFCGLLCLVASFCVGLHEILMSPDRPNYPTGRTRLRVLMFLWSGVLLYRAAEYLQLGLSGGPTTITIGQVLGCSMVAAVHGTFLENHLRQWLPARTHLYIRRLLDIATCGKAEALRRERQRNNGPLHAGVTPGDEDPHGTGAALVELARVGATVLGPFDGPEALLDLPPSNPKITQH